MNDVTTSPSRADIEAAYMKVAAEAGDLYFVLEQAESNITAIKAKLESLKTQRTQLQKQFSEVIAAAAPESV